MREFTFVSQQPAMLPLISREFLRALAYFERDLDLDRGSWTRNQTWLYLRLCFFFSATPIVEREILAPSLNSASKALVDSCAQGPSWEATSLVSGALDLWKAALSELETSVSPASPDREAFNSWIATLKRYSLSAKPLLTEEEGLRNQLISVVWFSPLHGDDGSGRVLSYSLIKKLAHNEFKTNFWSWWYEQLLDGNPPQKLWDLTERIAREVPEDAWAWDDGKALARVAAKIRKIEAEWETEHGSGLAPPPEPEPIEPSNVVSLFDRATVVTSSMASLSYTVNLQLDAFDRLDRSNEPIPFVETLRRIPTVADEISAIVQAGREKEGADITLAEQVGLLQAEVARLKADLMAAYKEIESLKGKPWYKSAPVLGAAVCTVVAGLWAVGSSDKSLEEVTAKLGSDVQWAWEQLCPICEADAELPKRLEISETFET